LESPAFKSKGFSGLDVPTQSLVLQDVFAAAQDPQVLDAIVALLPVDVMHVLSREKITPQMAFHNKAVFHDLFPTVPNKNISGRIGSTSAALANAYASITAKPEASTGISSTLESDAATLARINHSKILTQVEREDGTGRDLYHAFSNFFYDNIQPRYEANRKSADKAASEYLKSLGIRGIKYLDGSSRHRPIKDIKSAFLKELPEDADFDDVLQSDKFDADQKAFLKALAADDWLGFDYPAQAISAALGSDRAQYDISPELKKATEALSKDASYNYVIFSDEDVSIDEVFFNRQELIKAREHILDANTGVSQTQILENATFKKQKNGIVAMNENALWFVEKAFQTMPQSEQSNDKVLDKETYIWGVALPARSTEKFIEFLENIAANTKPEIKPHLNRIIDDIRFLVDREHGDIAFAYQSPLFPEVSKTTAQEELGHLADIRTGVSHEPPFLGVAEYHKAKRYLIHEENYSPTVAYKEIIGKIQRDDAAKALNLTEAEVDKLRDLRDMQLRRAGITEQEYIDTYASISDANKRRADKYAKQHLGRNRQSEPETSGDDGPVFRDRGEVRRPGSLASTPNFTRTRSRSDITKLQQTSLRTADRKAAQEKVTPAKFTVRVGYADRPITIYKNPTPLEYQAVRLQTEEHFGKLPPGEPYSRQTKDAKGNTYIWSASATHSQVEPRIKELYGLDTNQNALFNANERRTDQPQQDTNRRITGDRTNDLLAPSERRFIEARTKGDTALQTALETEVAANKDTRAYTVPRTGEKGAATADLLTAPFRAAVEIGNAAKALKSSIDLSAAGRQGLIMGLTNPRAAFRAFRRQLQAMRPGKGAGFYDAFKRDLDLHPYIELAEESGLYLGSLASESMSAKEEAFMSKILGQDKVFDNTAAEKTRQLVSAPVRISERGYLTYLDSLRMDAFRRFADEIHAYNIRKGLPDDPDQYKGIAKFINYATGRGDLGKLNEAVPILNATLWSARYWASRLQVLNPAFYGKLPPGARKIAFRELMKFGATVGAMFVILKMLGFEVEADDPNDPDTLKVGFGNFKYDITGGLVQHIRYLIRMAMATQEKNPARKMQYLTGRYLRAKLAPGTGAIVNAATGTNYIGEPTSAKEEAALLFQPLSVENFTEAARAEGWPGIGKMMPELFGISVTRYAKPDEIRKKLEAEQQKAQQATTPAEKKEAGRRIKAWQSQLDKAIKYQRQ
jgi:hypothetical protein